MPKGGRLEMNDGGDISLLTNASLDKIAQEYSQTLARMREDTDKLFSSLSDKVKAEITRMHDAGITVTKESVKNIEGYQEKAVTSYLHAYNTQIRTEKELQKAREEENKKYFHAGELALQKYLSTTNALERQQTLKDMKEKEKTYVQEQKLLQTQLDFQMQVTTENLAKTNNRLAELDEAANNRKLTAEEKTERQLLIQQKKNLEARNAAEEKAKEKSIANTKKAEDKIKEITKQQTPGALAAERKERIHELGEEREALKDEEKGLKAQRADAESQLTVLEASGKGKSPEAQALHELLNKIDESIDRNGDQQKEASEKQEELTIEQNELALKNAVSADSMHKALKEGFKKMVSSLLQASDAIDQKISTFYQYQAKMNARLQGTNKTWGDSLNMIARNVALSPLIKQSDVVTKMQALIESGIAYDVELRAFLGTISEDIASTFDVMQASLARMIRVQQSDSTAMRLGMEAYLTKFYNGLFSDTSYLTDQFDSVTDAIFEASARLEKAQSIEFEYAVQKWLGSLYSLGLSQQTVNQIASGLNYLGTGDVEALNGNTQLTTLFGMAASQAEGISYSDLITNGLDASSTNKLMESMVRYLRDIAEQTKDNNVVAKSYSNILGISMSDLTVLSKIDNQTLTSISDNMLSYGDTLDELTYQTSQINSRVHLSTKMGTLGDNALTTAALGIGGNPVLYPMWWATKLFKDLTGGISIPFVNVMGFGLDLETTLADLVLTGIAGLSLLGTLLGSITSGGSPFGSFDLGVWGYKEGNVRGTGVPKIGKKGVSSGFSQSSTASTGTGSGSDIEGATLSSGAESGSERGKTINSEAGMEAEKTIVDVYKALFEDKLPMGLEEQILEASNEMLDLLSTSAIKTNIVKSISLPTDTTVINTPIVVLGGVGGAGTNVSTATIDGSSSATAVNAVSSIVNTSEASMNSIQSVETALDKYNAEGESSLNVNVMSMPDVELGSVGSDAQKFMTDFTNKVLVSALSIAIRNSLSRTSSDDNEPIDIISLLTEIKDYTWKQSNNVSEINNSLDTIKYRTNQ